MNLFPKTMKFCSILVLLLSSFSGFSQYKFSKDPFKLPEEVKKMMEASKNPENIKLSERFNNVWFGSFYSDKQKIIITDQAVFMSDKKYKPNPVFFSYFEMITSAAESSAMTAAKIDSFLYVVGYSIDYQADILILTKFFNNCSTIFSKKALYYSNYNKLYVKAQDYSFFINDGSISGEKNLEKIKTPTTPEIEPKKDEPKKKPEDEWGSWDTSEASESWGNGFANETQKEKVEEAILAEPNTQSTPMIKGPSLRLKSVEFTMVTPFDSASWSGSDGVYMFENRIFSGNGGQFDWSPSGMSVGKAFVKFNNYFFDVSKAEMNAENVSLNYPDRLDKELDGSFQFKSLKRKVKSINMFPKFISYSSLVDVKNLGQDLIYKGGFGLDGKQISSTSYISGSSTLEYSKYFKVIAPIFRISDSLISAPLGSVILKPGNDTIFHPAVQFSYKINDKTVVLSQERGLFKDTKYYDSYHKINIKCDIVIWKLNNSKIEFMIESGKDVNPAIFESIEYFNTNKYNQIQGILRFHPLQVVMNFSRSKKTGTFNYIDLAKENKLNEGTVKAAMSDLAKEGLVDFIPNTGAVTLLPKCYHYFVSKSGRKDFDNITIESISPKASNATYDLISNDLTIRGVKSVSLSDSLGTMFSPDSTGSLIIQKNRTLLFSGQLKAGKLNFVGKRFRFDYDSFFVDMDEINELDFNFTDNELNDKSKKANKKRLGVELESAKGSLYITKPNNKASSKSYPEYPIFSAKTGAMVYFDKPTILQGTYDRKVYFKIPPFEVDSLNSPSQNAISFDGTFVSDGIFPDINEKLLVREDQSLGFVHKAPKEGYPIYGTKTIFFGKISLNYSGIRGNGKLNYLSTQMISNDMVFFQDSLIGTGQKGVVKETTLGMTEYAQSEINKNEFMFEHKRDVLTIHAQPGFPIFLYNKQAVLEGSLIISAAYMHAEGSLGYDQTNSFSTQIELFKDKFKARQAVIEVKSDNLSKPAILSKAVQGQFDLKTKMVEVAPDDNGIGSNEFPYTQYNTSISNLSIDLKKQKVTMKKAADVPLASSIFYSVHPEQDSLFFMATDATYDMKKYILNVSGVPYIDVADTRVYPDSGKVTILENAQIVPFTKAKILMDTVHKYYNMVDAEIQVKSKNLFESKAYFPFTAGENVKYNLLFSDFILGAPIKEKNKKSKETYRFSESTSQVLEEDKFYIDEKILFKGKIVMHAQYPTMEFDGFVKMDLKTIENAAWIPFKKEADSASVAINFNETKTEDGQTLSCGLHFDIDTMGVYSTFFTQKRNVSHPDIIKGVGKLQFNSQDGFYRVGKLGKILKTSAEGDYIGYNDNKGIVNFDGKLNIAKDTKEIPVLTIGEGVLKPDSGLFINTFLQINPNVPTKIWENIGQNLSHYVVDFNLPEACAQKERFFSRIGYILGDKELDKYKNLSEINYVPLANFNKKFANGIIFTDLNLKWSDLHKAFYSTSTTLGLANIAKNDVNGKVEGFLEIKKSGTYDKISIYIHTKSGDWYFLLIENNHINLLSSYEDFNSIAAQGKVSQGKYYYSLASNDEKNRFLQGFYADHLGKEYEFLDSQEKPSIEIQPQINSEEIPKENKVKDVTQKEELSEPKAEKENLEETPSEENSDSKTIKKPKEKKKSKQKTADELLDEIPNETDEKPVKETPKIEKKKEESGF